MPTLEEQLFEACAAGNPTRVSDLISDGANPNDRGHDGDTALHIAVLNQHYDIATILLENGADVNAENDDG